jgi:uncharacterized protein
VGQLDFGDALLARGGKEDQGEAALRIVHPARFAQPDQAKEVDCRSKVRDSDHGVQVAAQASVDRDSREIRGFFAELGFPAAALQPTGVNVSTVTEDGVVRFTVRQRMALRSTDIRRAQAAVRRQFDLVRRGVLLEEGSGMAYTFTRLNDIKPVMVAAATRDARAAAEQFAKDSGTSVGTIKSATQGYFEITARDGDSGGGWGVSDSPDKKVRVVTTVDFYLR